MHINGVEEDSEILIDDDADTCVNLTESFGCKTGRVQNLQCFIIIMDEYMCRMSIGLH